MKFQFNEFNDNWKSNHLHDTELHLYSAYYDDRKRALSAKEGNSPVIRINVVAPKSFNVQNKKTVCLVKLKDGSFYAVRIHVIKLLEHFNMKWSSYFVNCKLTEIITNTPFFRNQTKPSYNKIEKYKVDSVALINSDLKYYHIVGNYNFSSTLPGELKVHTYKTVSNKSSKNRQNMVSDVKTLALCVKPVYLNWNRAIWLVEFFEMYRLLGKK